MNAARLFSDKVKSKMRLLHRKGRCVTLCLFFMFSGFFTVHFILSRRSPRFPKIESTNVRYLTDLLQFPLSRTFSEHLHISLSPSDRLLINNNITLKYQPSSLLKYSNSLFRTAVHPILWLDEKGDVRWNKVAEREALIYLAQKQFPYSSNVYNPSNEEQAQAYISDCQARKLIILEQWYSGFFSRVHCFIEQFGQTLYSNYMAVLAPRKFLISNAGKDDFLEEGILRYFAPISICSAYMHDDRMKSVDNVIRTLVRDGPSQSGSTMQINRTQQLRVPHANMKYILIRDIWKFGYEHIPFRHWLLDRNRAFTIESISYYSSADALMNHSNEHIYQTPTPSFDHTKWSPRNRPIHDTSDILSNIPYNITINDRIFTSFLRYMFIIFFSQLAPRIQSMTRILTEYWSSYLVDKQQSISYNTALRGMAGIFVRRGDKYNEDSFYQKFHHWRNISLFVKGLVDEEKRRKMKFSSVYVLTDDNSVMNSLLEYANPTSNGTDELYARKHMRGRQIMFNVLAPQACFDPFVRIGFDMFLTSVNFLIQHADHIVSHTDSNVGRYLEEVLYALNQERHDVHSQKYVRNAPDTLWD